MLQIAVLEGWKLHTTAFLISQIVANVLVLLLSMWQDRRERLTKKSTDASQANAGRRDDRKQPGLSLTSVASVKFTAEHGRSITARFRAQSWSDSRSHARHDTDTDREIASERGRTRGRSSARGMPLIELDPGARHSLSRLKKYSRPVELQDSLDGPTPGLRYLLSGPERNQDVDPKTKDSVRSTPLLPSPA